MIIGHCATLVRVCGKRHFLIVLSKVFRVVSPTCHRNRRDSVFGVDGEGCDMLGLAFMIFLYCV